MGLAVDEIENQLVRSSAVTCHVPYFAAQRDFDRFSRRVNFIDLVHFGAAIITVECVNGIHYRS